MTWIVVVGVLWTLLAIVLVLAIGPGIGHADRREELAVLAAGRDLVAGLERELSRLPGDHPILEMMPGDPAAGDRPTT